MSAASASLRRGLRWTLAILLAVAVLTALSVRASASGEGGVRGSLDAVRLLAAGLCVLGAGVAALRASRAEAVGLWVAALTLGLCVAGDYAVLRFVGETPDAVRRLLLGNAAWSLAVLGVPTVLGAWLLRIPAADLLRTPARPLGPVVAGVVAGLFLYPALSHLQVGIDLAAGAALGPWPSGAGFRWPGVRTASMQEAFPTSTSALPLHVFLQIALQLPLIEILLHGVLRQAFLRWGALPFVVGTAVLAALVRIRTGVDAFAFGGSLVTGWLAARSGSVFPGIAFWTFLFLGWIGWGWLIQPV